MIFEGFFPMFFEDENLKNCLGFYFPTLETLFLEHSKSGKITRKSQIFHFLEFENHKNLKLSIFRRVVRAGKKICSLKYFLGFFKICPSFNNPAELV